MNSIAVIFSYTLKMVVCIAYPFEPARHGVGSVAANVRVDDDDGEERRQSDESHAHAEVRA